MDPLSQAFKAHAAPALAEKPARSAYVFGAASPLGEAMLNQLLASAKYTQVCVATQADLPATIAHLRGFEGDAFAFQNLDAAVDVFFIAKTFDAMTQVTYLPHIGTRRQVYKPLALEQMVALFGQVSSAIGRAQLKQVQWCVLTPDAAATQSAQTLAPYLAGAQSLVYGLEAGSTPSREGTVFQPQGTHFLDRMGAGLLNLIAKLVAQMANPKAGANLTSVKTAQRIVQRFESLSAQQSALVLTPQDLASER